MKEYVLDSNVVLLYLRGAPDRAKVAHLFREALEGRVHISMSAVNWAECRHLVTRRHGATTAEELLSKIGKGVEIVAADRAQADLVGNLRCRFNASLADCFAASLAIDRRATLVTADPEFEALKSEVRLLRLES